MNWFQHGLLGVMCVTLFACGSNPGPSARNKPGAPDFKAFGQCLPESRLLAAGIVRGEVVKKGDPDDKAVVLLLTGNSICTASPIADDVLLTAAHCVDGNAESVLGVFHPSLACESGYEASKHAIKAKKVIKHLGYDESKEVEQRSDDIAIIFLESKIPAGYPVYKIADPNQITNINEMFVYGYGIIGENQGGRGILRKGTITPENFSVELGNKKVMVRQDKGVGICMGDSGGPTFVTLEGEKKILGVNSYVFGPKGNICNKESYQTLVHAYNSWINLEIDAYRAEKK